MRLVGDDQDHLALGVQLVEDQRPDLAQGLPAALRRQQNIEGLGRRDEDMGRPLRHRLPLARRRIAGAYTHSYLWQRRATALGQLIDLGQSLCARNRATSSTGRCVADKPMRVT